MASPNAAMCIEELSSDLECRICTVPYQDPRVLTCQHVFCVTCLDKLCGSRASLTCPLCRKQTLVSTTEGVRALPKPLALNRLRDTLNTYLNRQVTRSQVTGSEIARSQVTGSQSNDCDVCDGDNRKTAILFCQDCLVKMCVTCFKEHQSLSSYAGHVSTEIKHYPTCRLHSNNICKQCCTDCLVEVCVKCLFAGHKGHKVTGIETAKAIQKEKLSYYRSDLNKRTKDLNTMYRRLLATVTRVQTGYDANVMSVRRWSDDIINKVQTASSSIINQLEADRQRNIGHLESNRRALNEVAPIRRQQMDLIASSLTSDVREDVLAASKAYRDGNAAIKGIRKELYTEAKLSYPSLLLPEVDQELDGACVFYDCDDKADGFYGDDADSVTFEDVSLIKSAITEQPETRVFIPAASSHPIPVQPLRQRDVTINRTLSSKDASTQTLIMSQPDETAATGSAPSPGPRVSVGTWGLFKREPVRTKRIIDCIVPTFGTKIYLRTVNDEWTSCLTMLSVESGEEVSVSELGHYSQETGIAFDNRRGHVILGFWPKRLSLHDGNGEKLKHYNIRGLSDVSRLVYCDVIDRVAVTDGKAKEVHIIMINQNVCNRVRGFPIDVETESGEGRLRQPVAIDFDNNSEQFAVSDFKGKRVILYDVDGVKLGQFTHDCMGEPNGLSFGPSGTLFGCTFNAGGASPSLWAGVRAEADSVDFHFRHVMKSRDLNHSVSAIHVVKESLIIAIGYPKFLFYARRLENVL